MYKDEYHPAVKKDLKKVDAPIREEIKATNSYDLRAAS